MGASVDAADEAEARPLTPNRRIAAENEEARVTPWRPANTLRLATWNVNSLKARLSRVLEWLEYAQPDILCLQETKLAPESFPTPDFEVLGYECAVDGQGQWNGVAVLSRVGLAEVRRGFDALLLDKFAASPGAGDLVPASTSGQELSLIHI